MTTYRLCVDSPVGPWGLEGTDAALTRVRLPHEFVPGSDGPVPAWLREAADEVASYLAGRRRSFTIPFAAVEATPFQREVWAALAAIPYGEVRTYGEIARAVGRPHAARAVGNANHANPWPLVVPCHRVVASTGIGGYGGGEEVKRFLLALEGVAR